MSNIVQTIILFLMSVGLVVSGILLWKRRLETGDYSRYIQAIFSWVSAIFAFTFIFRTWAESMVVSGALLEPEHTFVPLLIQMAFFLYPLAMIRPMNPMKVYALLFAPLLVLFIIGMCGGIQYTTIQTYSDLWQHIAEPNVLFRLFALMVMLLYGFSLFLVPYDWRKSSADRHFIRNYAIGYCLIGVFHFAVQLSHSYIFLLLHQMMWIFFFLSIAYYELKERLLMPKVKDRQGIVGPDSETMDLWGRIVMVLENEARWRDPNLGLNSLSDELKSNRTYVGDAFKQNTGLTFVEYITKRRIDYVVGELKQNPQADIWDLFVYVGYGQRTTATRNFQKITGTTPSEFVKGLK